MTMLLTPPHHTHAPATPVCDRCATAHSATGWRALDDGMQLCQVCWQDVMCPTDPPVLTQLPRTDNHPPAFKRVA